MATTLQARWAALAARLRSWLTQLHPDPPVDVGDPLGGALKDAELLIAFAAQSRRSVDKTKALSLAETVSRVTGLRAARTVIPAADSAAFWAAYDAFAVEMAPLSAHSIRASLRINRTRFPRSLLTPAAVNALLAVVVFYVFLSLQSFWVAGKEMVDRADELERQKAELSAKVTHNAAERAAAERQRWSRYRDRCAAAGDCAHRTDDTRRTDKLAIHAGVTATLDAELRLLDDQISDKLQLGAELADQRDALGFRSRPLEDLMTSWYGRARQVCSVTLGLAWLEAQPMAFICSVQLQRRVDGDSAAGDAHDERRQEKRRRFEQMRVQADKQQDENIAALEKSTSSLRSGYPAAPAAGPGGVGHNTSFYARPSGPSELDRLRDARLQQLVQELADLDTDHFSRVTAEVRMIVSNLGTYLIALVMGLLGALTFILRTLSQQLREHTYVPVSISEGVVRICLGAIAGVFGSLLVPSAGAELKSLPPIFVPFVFGYGIEILFSMLDRLVRSFTQSDTPGSTAAART